MEKKQTAVDYLVNVVNSCIAPDYIPNEIVNQAKQMEKEQINKAWENGFRSTGEGWNGEIPPECHGEVLDTEQYYNETFKHKNK